MNLDKIAAIYEISDDKVKKALKAAGLDHNAADFSRTDLTLFDEVLTLITEGKSYKDATLIMQERAEASKGDNSSAYTIDPKTMEIIERQSEEMARQIAGETPEVFLQQKEMIKQVMVKKLWEKFAAIAESGELQRNFERVLGSNNPAVIEATVLPGESPALPENSSSGT